MTPLRASLFNPKNAVPDRGISMRNGWLAQAIEPKPAQAIEPKQAWIWPGQLCGDFWLANDLPPRAPIDSGSRLDRIKKAVSEVWYVGLVNLESARRDRRIVIPRQVAIALCRRLTKLSFPQIGRGFGGRDHTTCIHAIRKMQPHIDAVAAELPANATALEWARAMKRRIDRELKP